MITSVGVVSFGYAGYCAFGSLAGGKSKGMSPIAALMDGRDCAACIVPPPPNE
ncbi:hypothetical protein CMMCAS08_16135 [Clavibacter michiganensis subsp. michiganensis]|nr:hypothetical protein CMMCAS08_16135 [Clavibacter michiganensis subsp. michiganensis]